MNFACQDCRDCKHWEFVDRDWTKDKLGRDECRAWGCCWLGANPSKMARSAKELPHKWDNDTCRYLKPKPRIQAEQNRRVRERQQGMFEEKETR